MKFVFLFFFSPVILFSKTLIIAHRGASGYLPEHTLESYELGYSQGADFIEPDLVFSKDGVLVARHENNIAETTNAHSVYPQFQKTKIIDGEEVKGIFTEDLTLKQLKKLKATQRLKQRPQDKNDLYEIRSLEEILVWLRAKNKLTKKNVGLCIELKHPSYFKKIGFNSVDAVLKTLKNFPEVKVIFQVFELESLKELKKRTKSELVYLVDQLQLVPGDVQTAGGKETYGSQLSEEKLSHIRKYVDGLGLHKRVFKERADLRALLMKLKLKTYLYTFRVEKEFLEPEFIDSFEKEQKFFFSLKPDAIFTDFPDRSISLR